MIGVNAVAAPGGCRQRKQQHGKNTSPQRQKPDAKTVSVNHLSTSDANNTLIRVARRPMARVAQADYQA